jgi:hypothetical protein
VVQQSGRRVVVPADDYRWRFAFFGRVEILGGGSSAKTAI